MRAAILLFALFSGLLSHALGADTIELANGKTLNGNLSGRQAIYVTLILQEGRSEIERRLKPEEIKRILFSDSILKQEAIDRYPTSDPYQATSLLERLVRKRLPYIDLLSHSDEMLFAMLLESYIHSGRANDALDRAKLWRTKLRASDIIAQIEELQIVAAKSAGNLEEAAFYSKRWIEAGQSARVTALPWSLLADKSLSEGRIEEALWLALNPIVFTHPDNPRFLENAYEIAVFSAYQLKEYDYAYQLYSEMKLRRLNWPIDSDKADVISKLENALQNKSPRPSRFAQAPPNPTTGLNKVLGQP